MKTSSQATALQLPPGAGLPAPEIMPLLSVDSVSTIFFLFPIVTFFGTILRRAQTPPEKAMSCPESDSSPSASSTAPSLDLTMQLPVPELAPAAPSTNRRFETVLDLPVFDFAATFSVEQPPAVLTCRSFSAFLSALPSFWLSAGSDGELPS